MRTRTVARAAGIAVAALSTAVATALTPSVAQARDTFYSYSGTTDLAALAPGTVLDVRTVPFHLAEVPTPLTAIQVLYRSTDAGGNAVANVTSVIRAAGAGPATGVISYQSAYDSLNPEDSPSRAVAGDIQIGGFTSSGRNLAVGGLFFSGEVAGFALLLAQGFSIVVPDTEGQQANFAAGPEYGMNTLDSLRAVARVPETGIAPGTRTALMGYSGGAIASNWAAILAPEYAPEIAAQLIGVAQGGLLAVPAHTLRYASGSLAWAGVVGMALVGISRSYGIDVEQYLSDHGKQVFARLRDASIINVFLQYPGLTWQQMVLPQYADPNSIPEFTAVANAINMGLAPIPTIPMLVYQGTGGIFEGTAPGGPGLGDGDGIMIAGDVRALLNRYCATGLPVQYRELPLLSHGAVVPIWALETLAWVNARFAGEPAPTSCGQIAPGNALEPEVYHG
ncbi:lipase family protein [Nocardia sp. NPDC057227]|uniref:lipase family protein n=1 Tax=Nocardia sp. NPDC057227 TaxID=3346056 RepID=UPI00363F61B3